MLNSADRETLRSRGVRIGKIGAASLVLFYLLGVGTALAATRTWDNDAGNGLWSTCQNWSGNKCPGASDLARFKNTSAANAIIDTAFAGTVGGIEIQADYTGTIAQARALAVGSSGYTQAGGVLTGDADALSVSGAFTLSGGTFTAPSATLSLASSFSHTGGTFAHNGGTVQLTGASQTLSGAATFNHLTKIATGGDTLVLSANTAIAIEGAASLQGSSDAQRLILRSSVTGSQASVNFQGSRDLRNLDVQDIANTHATAAFCYPGCVDNGNNANLIFGDDDSAGITLSPSGGSTAVTEGGASDTYTVVLDVEPAADVTISISAGSAGSANQVLLDLASLTFTPSNWNTVQTITVTAINDNVAEGNHASTLSHLATSSDSRYEAKGESLTANIVDDDSAGVSIVQSGGTTTPVEGGATDVYSVVLTSEPTAPVTLEISVGAETNAAPTALIFTGANWSTAQGVSVTAVDDAVSEGNHRDTLVHTATSRDVAYHGIEIESVLAAVTDNDSAGVSVSQSAGATAVGIDGSADTLALVLATEPEADVVILLDGGSQLVAIPPQLVFTPGTWSIPQSATLYLADGADISAESAALSFVSQSGDTFYRGIFITPLIASIVEGEDEGEEESETEVESAPALEEEEDEEGELPLADAGRDTSVLSGTAVRLDGSASAGETLSYAWRVVSGSGTLEDADSPQASYETSLLLGETAELQLTVTDARGRAATDAVSVRSFLSSDIQTDTLSIPLAAAASDGMAIYDETGEDGRVRLAIGEVTIHLPESVCSDYSLAMSQEHIVCIGCPDANGGRGELYCSTKPLDQVSGEVFVESAVSSRAETVSGDGSYLADLTDQFVTISGTAVGEALGAFLAFGDIDGDGFDECLASASSGAGGRVDIYQVSQVADGGVTLIGSIQGSEEYPVNAIMVDDYIAPDESRDIFFAPRNTALNANLRYHAELASDDKADQAFIVAGREDWEAGLDLSGDSPDLAIRSDGANAYQASVFRDFDGDGDGDLIMADDRGDIALFCGPLEAGRDLSQSDADGVFSAGEIDGAESFGAILAVGDVSGDGLPDLAIGHPGYGEAGEGAVHVVLGDGTCSLDGLSLGASGRVLTVSGTLAGDAIGSDLLLSDTTGDGYAEIFTVKASGAVYKIDLLQSTSRETSGTEEPETPSDAPISQSAGSGGCSLGVWN